MCDEEKMDKKEPTAYEVVMSQPPSVWIALGVGFMLATLIKK